MKVLVIKNKNILKQTDKQAILKEIKEQIKDGVIILDQDYDIVEIDCENFLKEKK